MTLEQHFSLRSNMTLLGSYDFSRQQYRDTDCIIIPGLTYAGWLELFLPPITLKPKKKGQKSLYISDWRRSFYEKYDSVEPFRISKQCCGNYPGLVADFQS